MMQLTRERVLEALRYGNPDQRRAFLQTLPPSTFKEASDAMMSSDTPTTIIIVLVSMVQEYCYGRAPREGAVLAVALHDWARELCDINGHAEGLEPYTISGLASNHLKALSMLARHEELLVAANGYIRMYAGEPEKLPSMRVFRVEALVMLERYDQAVKALQDCDQLFSHPFQGMELRRLRARVEEVRGPIFDVRDEHPPTPHADRAELVQGLATAMDLADLPSGNLEQILQNNRSLDPSPPADHTNLLKLLKRGDARLIKGEADSDLAVSGAVREASAIFVHGTPSRERILESRQELLAALAWGIEHQARQIENDANWGLYLCASRLGEASEAADALIRLRNALENRRKGIAEPTERAGIFGQYRYLFNAMCEQLHKAGRAVDLLEAIESSKGRAIADRKSETTGDIVPDSAIYGCVAKLPLLARANGFHYLSFFVDDDCVYAAFVDKGGRVHIAPRIDINSRQIRSVAVEVAPERWGRWSPASVRIPSTADVLAPLVGWLSDFVDQGTIARDDHIILCPDDSLHNIPFAYLPFRGAGIMLEWFSISKVHSAFLVDRVLAESTQHLSKYAGFVVPAVQDRDGPNADQMLAGFEVPVTWLSNHFDGASIRHEAATVERIESETLDHRIVHFSCHGWFQPNANPFTHSYLVLAFASGLPNRDATNDQSAGLLTPRRIFDMRLDFAGSHVSTMACLSGLTREGVAGDALGLDWAFLDGGATSLLSTHWKVDVGCAATVFVTFYENWQTKKMGRAAALRATLLQCLNGDLSPESLQKWAGFSLTGDHR